MDSICPFILNNQNTEGFDLVSCNLRSGLWLLGENQYSGQVHLSVFHRNTALPVKRKWQEWKTRKKTELPPSKVLCLVYFLSTPAYARLLRKCFWSTWQQSSSICHSVFSVKVASLIISLLRRRGRFLRAACVARRSAFPKSNGPNSLLAKLPSTAQADPFQRENIWLQPKPKNTWIEFSASESQEVRAPALFSVLGAALHGSSCGEATPCAALGPPATNRGREGALPPPGAGWGLMSPGGLLGVGLRGQGAAATPGPAGGGRRRRAPVEAWAGGKPGIALPLTHSLEAAASSQKPTRVAPCPPGFPRAKFLGGGGAAPAPAKKRSSPGGGGGEGWHRRQANK